MLHGLKWPTLQIRRKYFRLVLLFKVINNILLIPHQYLPPLAKLTMQTTPTNFFTINRLTIHIDFPFSQELFQNGTNCKLSIYMSCHRLAEFKLHLAELLFHL